MKNILHLLLFFIFTISALAADIRFYNINDVYGTSIREVYSITKDDNGFIWGASKTGILRISSNNCRKYQLPHKSTDIYFTRLDYSNSILIAYTNNSQIFKYDPLYDRFDLLVDLKRLLNNEYIATKRAVVDKNKSIWIGTSNGLYKYENHQLKLKVHDLEIVFISKYTSNSLFLATPEGMAIFHTDTDKLEYIYKYSRDNELEVSSFLYDAQTNQLWIGTISNGLWSYDISNRQLLNKETNKLPRQPILSIKKNTTSSLLIGIDGQGLWELSENGDKVLNIYKEDVNDFFSLHGDGVYDIFCDDNDRIWVATYTGGLSFFEQKIFPVNQITHQINNPNSLINNHVNKVIEDKKGNIWFATNNGVNRWNPKSNKWDAFYDNKQEQAKVFLALCEDNDGNIWAGSYSSGVYVLDGDTGRELNHYFQEKEENGFSGKFISDIFKDSQGNIWIGGTGNIICYKEKEKRFRIFDRQSMYAFAELSSDKLLLACDYGLISMNKNTGNKELLLNDCLVQDILINGNDIWLGTSGNGLVYFNYKTRNSKKYTLESGLTSNYVNSIMLDNDALWLGTESGLCRFSIKDKSVYEYPSSLSLKTVSFNTNSKYRQKNGNLIWGTNKGAVIFNPDLLYNNETKGKIFIQDIIISGKSIRQNKDLLSDIPINKRAELTLRYDQNNFTIELLPLSSSLSGYKFSWKLEDFDSDWSNPSDLSILTYTNLQKGNYNLKIRMFDSSGNQLDERSLFINVTPPFWQTWWFRLILLIIIIGIIAYLLRSYSNRLKQKHARDKIRFFTNIAHDIRTSVTLINSPIEELEKDQMMSEKSKYYLSLAQSQSKRLLSVATQLLDFQKVDIGKGQVFLMMTDIVALISQRCLMFEEMSRKRNIKLNFSSNQNSYITALDDMKIEKVVDNLISNAIKYSHDDTQVDIILTSEPRQWILEVKDYGLGISENAKGKLFREFYRGDNNINSKIVGSGIGLLLVKSYILMHEGNVLFESKENEGSSFKIVVPYKHVEEVIPKPALSEIKNNTEFNDDISLYKDIDQKNIQDKQMSILLVEDNIDLQNFLACSFRDQYNVTTASNGSEAWAIIQSKSFDLILSDILMPEMNGLELCKLVKSTFETSHIPVILLTSLAEKENLIEGLHLGADDYITKPFDIRILNYRISTILKNRIIVRDKALKLISQSDAEQDIFINELNDKFIKKALSIVHENMSNTQFGKEEFASEMHISSSLLYQKLKALTGQSPIDFIRSIRFNHALELLKTHQYTISDVSDICGFSSNNYFSTAFKKYFGKSPTEI